MKLHVRSWGDSTLPRTAVLVHGIAGAAGSWWRVAEALVERGYHCLAPDLTGHGQSPKSEAPYSIAGMAADLGDSLPAAPDVLFGFSLGGGLSLLAVLDGILRPRQLILVDPALATLASAAALLDNTEAAPRDVAAILAANPRWHPEDAAERSRQFSSCDWHEMRRILVHSPHWDLRPRIGELNGSTPTLFVLADPSELVPPTVADAIRRQLGSASVVVLPNTTHSVYRDDFDGFMRVVDSWLSSPRAA